MPAPELIDPVNASLLATDFGHNLAQHRVNAEFSSTQARLMHLQGMEKVGVREGIAMQEARQSAQAREILQARAASTQPGATS